MKLNKRLDRRIGNYGKRVMRDWAKSAVKTVKRQRKRRDLFAEAAPLIEQWKRDRLTDVV